MENYDCRAALRAALTTLTASAGQIVASENIARVMKSPLKVKRS